MGAGYAVALDIFKHLRLCHSVGVSVGVKVLDKIVGSVAHFALLAIKQRVGKARDVSRSLPNSRVHKDIRVQLVGVSARLNKAFSPAVLDGVLKSRAQRTVVPSIGKTSVYLAPRKNKSSALAQGDDFVHCLFGVFH